MPIYTRTGDKGKTSLLDGTRVLKSDPRIEACGTIDELNSSIGVALSFLSRAKFKKIKSELMKIQNDLFAIGSALANPELPPVPTLTAKSLEFEKLIDSLTAQLPPLKNFILPGGSKSGSHLHICRTLTRRAERRLVSLAQKNKTDNSFIIYFNRLSDIFFTLARYVNYKEKIKETKWSEKNNTPL